MNVTIQTIDRLAETLQQLQPMKPEYQQRLDKKIRLEFNYNSNHIEGNTLTYGETELLLILGDTMGKHSIREYQEMKAHDVAFQLIKEWAKESERPLTEQNIKNLNETILVEPYWKEAITPDGQSTRRLIKVGDYKEYPNSVRLQNGEIFNYATPAETPILMQELIEWYRSEEKAIHAVTLAAMLHYKFVRIHPFDDGNGRVARLLTNYVLLRNGLPPVIIRSSDKANYLRALHIADTGDYEPFISYIAEQLIGSLELSIKAAKGEDIEEFDDLDKEISVLKKELKHANKLSEKSSPKIIKKTFDDNIIPLLEMIEKKCAELNELFVDNTHSIYCKYMGQTASQYQVAVKGSNIYVSLKKFGDKMVEENKILFELKYSYGFLGLKKTINADQIWIDLDIIFQDYNYKIAVEPNKNNPIVFTYGNKASSEELQKIVTPIFKNIIERIKSAK